MNSFHPDKTRYNINQRCLNHFPELNGRMGKFYPGILNWEKQGIINFSNDDDICLIRLIFKVLDKTPGFDLFDEGFNGETPERVCEIIGMSPNITKDDYQISFDYTIIPIHSYEEAINVAKGESWCIAISDESYNEYIKGGNRFYFLANKNWKKEPRVPGINFPYDKYGYSLIAVEMSPDNKIVSITSRWTTGSCNNDFFISEDELRNILGDKFKALYINEERFK